MPPPPSACRQLRSPRSFPTSLTSRTPEGTSRAPRFGHLLPHARPGGRPQTTSPAPPVTPAAPRPRERLQPGALAAPQRRLRVARPCSRAPLPPGPPARACPSGPQGWTRAPLPARRSRRDRAAPDSRRQGPSPSRPKAGGKRSRESLPRPRSPRSPQAGAAGVGGTAAAARDPGPSPGPTRGPARRGSHPRTLAARAPESWRRRPRCPGPGPGARRPRPPRAPGSRGRGRAREPPTWLHLGRGARSPRGALTHRR